MRDTVPTSAGPETASDTESFRLMSNILDLASAAGHAAAAIREAGVPECRATAQADAFVAAVRHLPSLMAGVRGGAGYRPELASPEKWRAHHVQAMEIARHLQAELWELPAPASDGDDEPVAQLALLASRIEDGERLSS